MSNFIDTASPLSQLFLFGIFNKTHPQTFDVPAASYTYAPWSRAMLDIEPITFGLSCPSRVLRIVDVAFVYDSSTESCIPIELFDSRVFPFLCFSLSFLVVFSCYIFHRFRLGCSVKRVPYIHMYHMLTKYYLCARPLFSIRLQRLYLYSNRILVADVHIYPLNRTS